MSRARQADAELDSLIADITVDCYDEDEVLTAFENAFYDAQLPCPGSVLGEDVEVHSVSASNNRRELIATIQRAGRRHEVALLDINIDAEPHACSPHTGAGSATEARHLNSYLSGSSWRTTSASCARFASRSEKLPEPSRERQSTRRTTLLAEPLPAERMKDR